MAVDMFIKLGDVKGEAQDHIEARFARPLPLAEIASKCGVSERTLTRRFTEATGLILKAHTSNYLVQGFTASVPAPELAALARSRQVPFVHDLGSGALVDLAHYGLAREPTVKESIAEGADLVTFSGDKLLGGPQTGIVAGRADLVPVSACAGAARLGR